MSGESCDSLFVSSHFFSQLISKEGEEKERERETTAREKSFDKYLEKKKKEREQKAIWRGGGNMVEKC